MSAAAEPDDRQCPYCLKYFHKKGLGPHQANFCKARRMGQEMSTNASTKRRRENAGGAPSGGDGEPTSSERPSINKRKRTKKKGKIAKGYVMVEEVDPEDMLVDAPSRRRAARRGAGPVNDCLFYGDSITWGMAHNYTGRYDVPWPRMLEQRLRKNGLRMVEAGLCSRTTVHDDPNNADWMTGAEPHYFNGLSHFGVTFGSHMPTWLVLALGTNDLKVCNRNASKTRVTARSIAENCTRIIDKAYELWEGHCHEGTLRVVLLSPPEVRLTPLSIDMGYDAQSVAISKGFHEAFARVCADYRPCGGKGPQIVFAAAGERVDMSKSVDGVHVTKEANVSIAETVWAAMEPVLAQRIGLRPRAALKPRKYDDFTS